MFKVVLRHSRQPFWMHSPLTRDDKWIIPKIKKGRVLPE